MSFPSSYDERKYHVEVFEAPDEERIVVEEEVIEIEDELDESPIGSPRLTPKGNGRW